MTTLAHSRRLTWVSVLVLAAGIAATAPAQADTVSGTIEKVENDGRSVTIAGTPVAVSASRTNICVGGVCDQGREKLKPGMSCIAETVSRDGKPEARRLSCK